jgi:hypothetical protein
MHDVLSAGFFSLQHSPNFVHKVNLTPNRKKNVNYKRGRERAKNVEEKQKVMMMMECEASKQLLKRNFCVLFFLVASYRVNFYFSPRHHHPGGRKYFP